MFLLILFTPFKDEEDFVIDEIITALCERQINCLLGKYIVNNTFYKFCRGYFGHRCPFCSFDEKYNVCYTFSGPNKRSKMYAAIKG